MKKIKYFASVLFFTILSTLHSQPDTCKIGIFINSIYDLSFVEKSFTSNFWLWMNCNNKSLNLKDNIDFPFTKSTECLNFIEQINNGSTWLQFQYRNTMLANWEIKDYPFDDQKLEIIISSADYDTRSLVFIPDIDNSGIHAGFKMEGWEIENLIMIPYLEKEPTNYGDPSLKGGSEYSSVKTEINLTRSRPWLLYFKMLTGVFVSFLVASCCFLVSISQPGTRFSLCTGALFAAIASNYIIESRIPANAILTLIDGIHHFTFIMILIAMIISAIFMMIVEKKSVNSIKAIKKANIIALLAYLSVYAAVIAVLTISAYYSR